MRWLILGMLMLSGCSSFYTKSELLNGGKIWKVQINYTSYLGKSGTRYENLNAFITRKAQDLCGNDHFRLFSWFDQGSSVIGYIECKESK